MTQPPNAAHTFQFTVSQSGAVTGTSTWGSGTFNLTGQVDATGNIAISDDAQNVGFLVGIYTGTISANGAVTGQYFEGDTNNLIGNWSASR